MMILMEVAVTSYKEDGDDDDDELARRVAASRRTQHLRSVLLPHATSRTPRTRPVWGCGLWDFGV